MLTFTFYLLTLSLQNLLPTPLADRLGARPSDVWQQARSFGQGERVFVQAPSGTGKTTLMHVLYGLRTDYTGTVLWEHQTLAQQSAEQLAALRAGPVSLIFQDLRIFPELTAWENLALKRTLAKDSATEENAALWLDRLGMAHKKNSAGKTLSYGEQQRLAIVRALLQPFQFLLMDEPFSHLDAANTAKAALLIAEVCSVRNATFILADLDDNNHFPYTQKLML